MADLAVLSQVVIWPLTTLVERLPAEIKEWKQREAAELPPNSDRSQGPARRELLAQTLPDDLAKAKADLGALTASQPVAV